MNILAGELARKVMRGDVHAPVEIEVMHGVPMHAGVEVTGALIARARLLDSAFSLIHANPGA